jgi:cytochrome c biogenesis protein ResB
MKEQIKILVKLFKSTWLMALILALICTLVLHLLPMVLKNFMDKF